MLKIAGVIILLTGCIGYAGCLNASMNRGVEELKDFIYIFELLKSGIAYRGEMLPEACRFTGMRRKGKIGGIFTGIGEHAESNREKSFAEHWKEGLRKYFKDSSLKKKEQEYLTAFPEYIGFSDEAMQITVMEEYITQLKRRKEEQEQIYQNRKKVVLSICMASGGALVILLL